MGADKAAMQMRKGQSQLAYLLDLVEPFCERRALCLGPASAAKRKAPEDVLPLRDVELCSGPMAGVVSALRVAGGTPVLAIACDLPLLTADAVLQLVNRRDPDKLATAFIAGDGRPEPLCCLYEEACLPLLEAAARKGQTSLRRFLIEAEIERVLPASSVFLANVNHRSDLERLRRYLDAP